MLTRLDKFIIFAAAILVLASCNQDSENTEDYKKGYEQGLEDGRTQTCNEIENAKDSIHTFLENEGVCP